MLRALAALLLFAGAAAAEDVGAPEGAVRTQHIEHAYDNYDLPTGPATLAGPVVRALEGRVVWSTYRLDDPEATTAAIMEGYRRRLADLGYETVFDCASAACGGFDFRFGAAILPAPAMLIDAADFAQISVARSEPEAHVSVLVSRILKSVYVQVVTVTPAEPPTEVGAATSDTDEAVSPDGVIVPGIVEKALLDRLQRDGHVPIEGLSFNTGGAVLTEASSEALDLLARLLKRDAEMAVILVGHSDNEGGLDANITLSQKRAAAVMQALIGRGVPADQMEARGIGYLAPIASNATDEGRAANRRVELVLR